MGSKSSKTTDFFRKVGDAVLGVGKLPSKLKRKAKVKRKVKPRRRPEIPKMLQGFFERRHAGWPEYVMLKVQLVVLALFATAAIYLVFLHAEILIFPLLAFSAFAIYLAATQLKRAFERDYSAYRSFVGMCIAIAWVFVLALRHLPIEFSLESIYLSLIRPVAAIGFAFTAFMAFRIKYGRNFTYGRVGQIRGRRAAVRVGYDICSNVKAGLYTVESFAKVRKGDLVKLSVDRPMFGLRGARIKAILGRVR